MPVQTDHGGAPVLKHAVGRWAAQHLGPDHGAVLRDRLRVPAAPIQAQHRRMRADQRGPTSDPMQITRQVTRWVTRWVTRAMVLAEASGE